MKFRFTILLLFPLTIVFGRDKKFDQLYLKVNLQKIPIASSFLVEKGKPKNEFSGERLNDDKYDSAWCVTKNQGIGEYIYLPFHHEGPGASYQELIKYDYPISFVLFNGYSKSTDLFYANNRVKKIRIEFQEIAYGFGTGSLALANDIFLDGEPVLNSIKEIDVQDSSELQTFDIRLNPKIKNSEYFSLGLLAKLTILEVYPGTKWKDTCITEVGLYFDIEELKKRKN